MYNKRQKGGALISALLLVVITLLLTTGYVDTLTTENKTAKDNENWALALYAADAGIQYALEAVRYNKSQGNTPPDNIGGELFTTSPGNNNVRFTVGRTDPTAYNCPAGYTKALIGCAECIRYRSIGTVITTAGKVAARKIVEATFTNCADGNIILWNEYYI